MLNLQRDTQTLTQGQPEAERRLPGPAAPEGGTAAEAARPHTGQAAGGAGAGGPAALDAAAVAQRVYELMQQDLRSWKSRRAGGRWA